MKWNFNKLRVGDEKQGIRDGDMSDFSKTHYKSVVRESIQNSLDAKPKESDKPVIVHFNFKTYPKNFLPTFSSIEKRIEECFEYANNDDDLEFLSTMIESFQNNTPVIEPMATTQIEVPAPKKNVFYRFWSKIINFF